MTAIHNLANKYREDFKLPNLKLPFNNRQGFYFSIPQKDIQGKLPSKFIQVLAKKFFLLILAYEHLFIFFVILFMPVRQNQVLRHGNNIHCSTLELASVSKITIWLVEEFLNSFINFFRYTPYTYIYTNDSIRRYQSGLILS